MFCLCTFLLSLMLNCLFLCTFAHCQKCPLCYVCTQFALTACEHQIKFNLRSLQEPPMSKVLVKLSQLWLYSYSIENVIFIVIVVIIDTSNFKEIYSLHLAYTVYTQYENHFYWQVLSSVCTQFELQFVLQIEHSFLCSKRFSLITGFRLSCLYQMFLRKVR